MTLAARVRPAPPRVIPLWPRCCGIAFGAFLSVLVVWHAAGVVAAAAEATVADSIKENW
jgi:hypothetical protein